MKIMKKIFYLLIISVIFGCVSRNYDYYERPTIHKIVREPLPQWFYELPSENFIVGISQKTADEKNNIEAAKQEAAVTMSRNKASFTVNNFAERNSEDIMKSGKAELKINVSFSPTETNRIFSQLKLVDKTTYFDYFIALFSVSETLLDENSERKYYLFAPDWLAKNKILPTASGLNIYAAATSANLIDAWEKAAENARLQAADYLEKNVEGLVKSNNEEIDKLIALETNKIVGNLIIARSYIQTEMKNSLVGYKVYLEMEMKK